MSFYTKATLGETKENFRALRFVNHQGRDSTIGALIPIRENGAFKPARVRLIRGKSELLSGMCIITKLDISVRFGGDRPIQVCAE